MQGGSTAPLRLKQAALARGWPAPKHRPIRPPPSRGHPHVGQALLCSCCSSHLLQAGRAEAGQLRAAVASVGAVACRPGVESLDAWRRLLISVCQGDQALRAVGRDSGAAVAVERSGRCSGWPSHLPPLQQTPARRLTGLSNCSCVSGMTRAAKVGAHRAARSTQAASSLPGGRPMLPRRALGGARPQRARDIDLLLMQRAADVQSRPGVRRGRGALSATPTAARRRAAFVPRLPCCLPLSLLAGPSPRH